MISLAELPSDLLAQILFGSNCSFLTIRLWHTGDLKLQHKLGQGIEYMDLKDVRVPTCSKYPKLLFQLRNLRYLSITGGKSGALSSIENLGCALRDLNGLKLETLKIICNQVFYVFDLSASQDHSDTPVAPYKQSESSSYHLKTYFPSLRTLCVPHLEETAIAGLPDTLTVLQSGELEYTSKSHGLMSKLPRSLLIWDVDLVPKEENLSEAEMLEALRLIWFDAPPSLHTHGLFRSTWKPSISPIFRGRLKMARFSVSTLRFPWHL